MNNEDWGWYSREQAEEKGYFSIYTNLNGEEVPTTVVTEDEDSFLGDKGIYWRFVPIGRVVKWLRNEHFGGHDMMVKRFPVLNQSFPIQNFEWYMKNIHKVPKLNSTDDDDDDVPELIV